MAERGRPRRGAPQQRRGKRRPGRNRKNRRRETECRRSGHEFAYGARLRSYRFDKYRTKEKPEQKPSLATLTVAVNRPTDAKKNFADLDKVADAVFFTRDIVSEPANVIYPETLAERARELEELGVV